jgi:hypothetical protein
MTVLIRDLFRGGGGAMMGRKRLVQEQRLARNLTAPVAAALIVLATGPAVPAEEPLSSPNAPSATGSQANPAGTAELLQGRTMQEPGLSAWMTLPAVSDPAYWSSFDSSVGGQVRAGTSFDRNDAPSSSAAATPSDQLRVGSSYLGIQTQKNVQALQSLRRNDCEDDDECAEYSGLPKSGQPKASVKNFKRPFIGLSITRPLE